MDIHITAMPVLTAILMVVKVNALIRWNSDKIDEAKNETDTAINPIIRIVVYAGIFAKYKF